MEERDTDSTTSEELLSEEPVVTEAGREGRGEPGGPEDEGEPGGASPQEIRARKEYRARKRAEQSAQQEREARIAAEARLQAVEAQARQRAAQPPATPPRRFTTAEVIAAKARGAISEAEALDYIDETHRLAERRVQSQQQAAEAKGKAAQRELEDYFTIDPTLKSDAHPKAKEVAAAYGELVNTLGLPRSTATIVLAYRQVLGSVAQLKKQHETKTMTRQVRDTHAEVSGGGSVTEKASGHLLSRVPDHFLRHWEARGYSREEMLKEAKYIPPARLKRP